VESIFGVPWEDLTLEAVEAFVTDAGDEGLTWEAKGTERPHPGSVRRHVCAFANSTGGFFIVGASRESEPGPWRIDPVEFVGDEPGPWFSKVIRNGLKPVPWYDVKEWKRDGKRVAVVNVDPVAEPPCMTTSGEVFMRVSGESPRVDDPATLRRLYEQGEARVAEAEREALRAAELSPGEYREFDPPYMRLRLAFAPTGRAGDIGARLFTKSFVGRLRDVLESLPAAPLFPYQRYSDLGISMSQDAVVVREQSDENRQRWTIRAAWNGSVAVYLDVLPDPKSAARLYATAVFADAVRPAAAAEATLVKGLGGYGRAHVVLRVYGRLFTLRDVHSRDGDLPEPPLEFLPGGPSRHDAIQTWTDSEGLLSDDQFDRMRRELVRACGVPVFEPEEDSATSSEPDTG
jgi:hypothetical protein